MARPNAIGRRPRNERTKRPNGVPDSSEVLDIYQDMLAEAVISTPASLGDDGRIVKKRRVGGRIVAKGVEDTASDESDQRSITTSRTNREENIANVSSIRQQTVYKESDDSAGSDMDWEEVELKDRPRDYGTFDNINHDEGPLELDLGQKNIQLASRVPTKRKPATSVEKMARFRYTRRLSHSPEALLMFRCIRLR